ncbi:NitT/TauT family transport system substrate-binding protein [Pseudobacteriovorax antillogorgiicola]|uniref:NitT/TauT family transport system substrate-binding protein n=2 Tax=Pseudobacteriovorax antillogorgiicola TaxID=1513793 RepID=A0A1Y6CJH7_9BACT|nr:putative urea ABC transporter substrate-binding protein [Pseudobacteriovorax antillogorgiicola]TCS48230.1 NitT/TauT family transport system substrate-binding protein [Pseudobacteriovorax antillogorgiicola]SMF57322.1 NitT/TauT family transport system substrate-binding protein [Pseudobacteriovorax antillogorgiicola]
MKLGILSLMALWLSTTSLAKTYSVCWSHYTGWEPWGYAESSGILKKWADKYKIKIKLDLVNDYIESINLYTAGKYDACTMTNMDALTIPAVGGIDSTALIIGDFSNGNDGIISRSKTSVKELKGSEVMLVELSVSHYLLARALDMNGMKEKDLKLVNTSDADIGSVYSAKKGSAVTWNPILMSLKNQKGSTMLFDSSMIPGEIIDVMVVKSTADEALKKALTGAWYEVMSVMTSKSNSNAIAAMAKQAGSSVEDFKNQLKTTSMFYNPSKAVGFAKDEKLKKTMDYVRTFSFDKGLFGSNASSKDFLGIEFSDGSVLGNKKNVKLRFTAKYMEMAASNKL